MSFIGKAVKGIGQAIGLVPKTPQMSAIPTLPMVANTDLVTSSAMDVAAQTMAGGLMRGRTSTLLTGGDGDTEDQKYTSKVLLGQ